MAVLAKPTIKEQVLNKIPFLIDNAATGTLIEHNTAEIFAELQVHLGKSDAEYLDEDNYALKETSLVSDMVGVMLLYRQVITNMEGSSGVAATGNKILSKAKAGEAEAEFEIVSEKDGSKLVMRAGAIISDLKRAAMRKAQKLGFILDYSAESEFTITAMSQPDCSFLNIPLYDE